LNTKLRCDQYCYHDDVVNVCHNGSGEPCCIGGAGGF
jgi:hypothetical protein